MKDRYNINAVKTEKWSMDYLCFGEGNRPFVILPGLSVQSVMKVAAAIEEQYRELAKKYKIYVFDRRKELPLHYSIEDMAADTVTALQKLHLKEIILFGVSQGGMIAQIVAIEEPDLVYRLILGSTVGRIEEKTRNTVKKWIEMAQEGMIRELYLNFGEKLYPETVFNQSRELLETAAKTVMPEEAERFCILAEGILRFDILEDVHRILCPTLFLFSKDDAIMDEKMFADYLKRMEAVPSFEYKEFEGYGHAVYDLAPDFQDKIFQFLSKMERY